MSFRNEKSEFVIRVSVRTKCANPINVNSQYSMLKLPGSIGSVLSDTRQNGRIRKWDILTDVSPILRNWATNFEASTASTLPDDNRFRHMYTCVMVGRPCHE
jgi:hypothetical protein